MQHRKIITLILLQFLQLLQFSLVKSDCGFPGKPAGSTLSAEKSHYNEDEEVIFRCENKLLVFHINDTVSYSQPGGFYNYYHSQTMKQKCNNGLWTGGQPRCS